MKFISSELLPQYIFDKPDSIKMIVDSQLHWLDWEDELYEVRKWCDDNFTVYDIRVFNQTVTIENKNVRSWTKRDGTNKALPNEGTNISSPRPQQSERLLEILFETESDAMMFKLRWL